MTRLNRPSVIGGTTESGNVLIITLVISCLLLLLASWTEVNMEWALGKISGKPVDVPYWLAAVATFFTNLFGVAFNVICELCKLVWP